MARHKKGKLRKRHPIDGSLLKHGENIRETGNGESTPVFCFRYLHKGQEFDNCSKELKAALTEKLMILSNFTWNQISVMSRKKHGTELIPVEQMTRPLPRALEEDVKSLMVFRISDLGRLVGIRREDRFQAVFIDYDFTLYNHGS